MYFPNAQILSMMGTLSRKKILSIIGKQQYSLLSSKKLFKDTKNKSSSTDTQSSKKSKKNDIQPRFPTRTRFAPSPTGFLHMGSLRTALYNYLLAKSTNGTFILRIEDTDQKRLVQGAEANILDTLQWCGVKVDEGPIEIDRSTGKVIKEVGEYGPYKQSERSHIYRKYADELIDKGLAYRCFCSKDRLDKLAESAKKLVPPTTVSYDRHCTHLTEEASNDKSQHQSFVIRFKSPAHKYPPFIDLLHGQIDLQPQINPNDVRYEDPVLMKSDGLPTYHFANVIDDHLMKITHVIRGEEWLASTPKHIALYDAFGWDKPEFIHIPLLTTVGDKKLSKRSGDSNVMSLAAKGVLPEALVNFSVLFGWSPKRTTPGEPTKEIYSMKDLSKIFSINELTKGNAKVDDKKLYYFNKVHLHQKLVSDPEFFQQCVGQLVDGLNSKYANGCCIPITNEKGVQILQHLGKNLTTINDLLGETYQYLFESPDLGGNDAIKFVQNIGESTTRVTKILQDASDYLTSVKTLEGFTSKLGEYSSIEVKKKELFQVLRFALSGSHPGVSIDVLVDILGQQESIDRFNGAVKYLQEESR
ncbi:glutamate--tRNA ligase [Saccharomycopsis crataegensis]|uniref:Glutamate--tRNA ligase, mitochondrial n=1 Tax=Saccharomycopsis crataegensis TaxID=43959 RepID=A0AAV5QMI1_9ASCO|nr:glutamate--tRNA ligase [Saccharomycopsis crataegensis]